MKEILNAPNFLKVSSCNILFYTFESQTWKHAAMKMSPCLCNMTVLYGRFAAGHWLQAMEWSQWIIQLVCELSPKIWSQHYQDQSGLTEGSAWLGLCPGYLHGKHCFPLVLRSASSTWILFSISTLNHYIHRRRNGSDITCGLWGTILHSLWGYSPMSYHTLKILRPSHNLW